MEIFILILNLCGAPAYVFVDTGVNKYESPTYFGVQELTLKKTREITSIPKEYIKGMELDIESFTGFTCL